MGQGDGTVDRTDGLRSDARRDPPKLVAVGGDGAKGPGGRFQRGNQEQRKGHERRRRPQAVNVVAELDAMARKVVRELFRGLKGKDMTPQMATAIISGLRFRSELFSSFKAAEELAKVQGELQELQARFVRLKTSLVQK